METFNVVMLGMVGGWEWILIIAVVVLIFGGRKIPELMRGLGQGINEFKKAKDGSANSSETSVDNKEKQ